MDEDECVDATGSNQLSSHDGLPEGGRGSQYAIVVRLNRSHCRCLHSVEVGTTATSESVQYGNRDR